MTIAYPARRASTEPSPIFDALARERGWVVVDVSNALLNSERMAEAIRRALLAKRDHMKGLI